MPELLTEDSELPVEINIFCPLSYYIIQELSSVGCSQHHRSLYALMMLLLWMFNWNSRVACTWYILPKSCIQGNNISQTLSCDGCTYLFLLTMNRNIMLINFSLECTLVTTIVFQLSTGSILLAHTLLQKISVNIWKTIFYYAEYIFNNVKPPCHIVPVVWKLFLARSWLPFFSHKIWVLFWWPVIIRKSCKIFNRRNPSLSEWQSTSTCCPGKL